MSQKRKRLTYYIMSIKIITDYEKLKTEKLEDCVKLVKVGRKWILCNKNDNKVDVKFQVKNCRVKYTPEKYDKITIIIRKDAIGFFNNLNKFIKETEGVDIENIVKAESIGLKLSKDTKRMCTESLKIGDYCDLIINFNDVWRVNSKNYASLELIQFKKTEKPEEEEVINYFVDDA